MPVISALNQESHQLVRTHAGAGRTMCDWGVEVRARVESRQCGGTVVDHRSLLPLTSSGVPTSSTHAGSRGGSLNAERKNIERDSHRGEWALTDQLSILRNTTSSHMHRCEFVGDGGVTNNRRV